MTMKYSQPFVQDSSRNHRDQEHQDPRDNLMYGVRDMDSVDIFGNHDSNYDLYILATEHGVYIDRKQLYESDIHN